MSFYYAMKTSLQFTVQCDGTTVLSEKYHYDLSATHVEGVAYGVVVYDSYVDSFSGWKSKSFEVPSGVHAIKFSCDLLPHSSTEGRGVRVDQLKVTYK